MTLTAGNEEAVRSIERTALDYFDGWFDGDAERKARALHPEIVLWRRA